MEKRGLSQEEAEKELEKYGYNEIREIAFVSPFKILLRQIKNNYIIYLLSAAVIISFFVEKYVTAYTILAVIFVIITVGFIQEYKAEKAIKALKNILMPVSIVVRNGKEQEILSKEIVPGDIVLLRTGEKVPADCLILEEKEILVNESILTGESKEVRKTVSKTEKYTDKNVLFMGSLIVNGRAVVKVIRTGMTTKFGAIARMISTAEKELPLQKKINDISKYMAIVAVVFSVLTGVLMFFFNPAAERIFVNILILVIALAVSAFPEGFPVVLVTCLASGVYRMAQRNAIVNRMSIIETLGETTVICSDKTGTITKGEMTVKKIFTDNNFIEVSGEGYEAVGSLQIKGKKVDIEKDRVLDLLVKASVICNDAKIERTGEDKIYKTYGMPTEASLLIMAAKAGVHKEDLEYRRVEEMPFNSARKIMSVLSDFKKKKYVYSKGAPEVVLKKCKFIERNNGIFRLTEREKERILNMNASMTSEALRTLAVAYKNVKTFSKNHFEDELIFLGLVGIEDPPRKEVKESIALCMKAGIKVKMITGDNKETALAISKKIGLSGKVISGDELDKLNEEELSKIVDKISIFSRVKPEHKIKIVKALKINGEIVTMTGDGVNDAPALKESHIGVAMGKNGTDVSREVADLILKDDNFSTIVVAIKEGRTIFKNIRKFISYQLSCNYAELSILFFGVLLAPLLGWQIPLLLALQILFMNLVTDDLPAITLALTPSSNDIMEEKPRKKKQILNKSLVMWFGIAGFSMALMSLFVFFMAFNVFGQGIKVARTTAMLTLICVEIANAFNFMSFRRKIAPRSFFVNKYLFYASIISLAATVLIIYSPLNKIFETAPVGIIDWGVAILASLFIILIFNFLKYLNGKKQIFRLENF